MLLEYSYCFREYRGLRLMASVLSQVSEKGSDLGARWVLTTVRQENIPALKGCKNAGLEMHRAFEVRWRLFRRHITVHELPKGTPYPFETN